MRSDAGTTAARLVAEHRFNGVAKPPLPGAQCTVHGLRVLVADGDDLLPALPVLVADPRGVWEHVGHVIDRPEQLGAAVVAPWTGVTRLDLYFADGQLRLTGTAEPGGRPFLVTTSDPLGPWSHVIWLEEPARRQRPDPLVAPTRASSVRPRLRPTERIVRTGFGAEVLDFRWRSATWPSTGWRTDGSAGLRARATAGDADFIGLVVQHRAFTASTMVRLPPDGTGVEGGLVLRGGDRTTAAIGVRQWRTGQLEVVRRRGDNSDVVGLAPAEDSSACIDLRADEAGLSAEVLLLGGTTIRCLLEPPALGHRTVGPYAVTTGGGTEPASFKCFEYRGQEVQP